MSLVGRFPSHELPPLLPRLFLSWLASNETLMGSSLPGKNLLTAVVIVQAIKKGEDGGDEDGP